MSYTVPMQDNWRIWANTIGVNLYSRQPREASSVLIAMPVVRKRRAKRNVHFLLNIAISETIIIFIVANTDGTTNNNPLTAFPKAGDAIAENMLTGVIYQVVNVETPTPYRFICTCVENRL